MMLTLAACGGGGGGGGETVSQPASSSSGGTSGGSSGGTSSGTADYTGLAAITGGLTLTGADATGLTWDSTNVMCFTAGTLIRTAEGLVPAEELTQGMLV
jgi:hypothetical protein